MPDIFDQISAGAPTPTGDIFDTLSVSAQAAAGDIFDQIPSPAPIDQPRASQEATGVNSGVPADMEAYGRAVAAGRQPVAGVEQVSFDGVKPVLSAPEYIDPRSQLKAPGIGGIQEYGSGELEEPWVDPVSAAAGGFGAAGYGALRAGAPIAKAAGRAVLSAGSALLTEPVLGQGAEYVGEKYPKAAFPFALITGALSGMTIERAIENRVARALGGKKVSTVAMKDIADRIKAQLEADDLSDPLTREVHEELSTLAQTTNAPAKAPGALVENAPVAEAIKPKADIFDTLTTETKPVPALEAPKVEVKPVEAKASPEAVAKELGVVYNGEWEGGLHQFTDPKTGGSFSTHDATPGRVKAELEAKRAEFETAKPPVEPAPVEAPKKGLAEGKKHTDKSFSELSLKSDEVQTRIEAFHDKLDEQGLSWEAQKVHPELTKLYDERIAYDTAAAQKGYAGARKIMDEELSGLPETSLYASINSILAKYYSLTPNPAGVYMMSKYTGQALNNSEKTIGDVGKDISKLIFSKENPLADFWATMERPDSGLTEKGKKAIIQAGLEKAEKIHIRIREFFIDKKPVEAPKSDRRVDTTTREQIDAIHQKAKAQGPESLTAEEIDTYNKYTERKAIERTARLGSETNTVMTERKAKNKLRPKEPTPPTGKVEDGILHVEGDGIKEPVSPVEAAKIAGEATPKGTTLKEQKQYLVGEIDDLISKAPDKAEIFYTEKSLEEASARPSSYGREDVNLLKIDPAKTPMVTIDVPGDGKFTIVNSKEVLAEFKKRVDKNFPTTIKSGLKKPSKPSARMGNRPNIKDGAEFTSVREYARRSVSDTTYSVEAGNESGKFRSGEMDGWFTQGNYAIKMEAPAKFAGKGELEFTKENFKKVFPTEGLSKAEITMEFTLKDANTHYVLISDGKTDAVVGAQYVDIIKKQYPDAVPYVKASESPVTWKVGEETIGILMPMRTADITVAKEMWAGKGKTETPSSGGKGGNADMGGYADTGGYAKTVGHLKALEMPELVGLAKELMAGKHPYIARKLRAANGRALGVFHGREGKGEGKIGLRADLFGNMDNAMKTMAHEIGHLVDWMPEKTLKRGNILGHIGSLKSYTKTLLEEYPGSPNKILNKMDRAKLRRLAEKAAEKKASTGKVATEVTPDEILSVWRDVEAREKNPALYQYIASLSSKEKVSLVKDAMKNRVSEWMSFKHKAYDEATVDVRMLYQKLLREEIARRGLFERDQILGELKALTQKWKPFNELQNANFTKYRYSNVELVADAMSVFLNDPQMLKEVAPKYRKAILNYMERKPEFKAAWEASQKLYKEGDVQATRETTSREMSRRGEKVRLEKAKKEKLTVNDVTGAFKKAFVDENNEILGKIKRAKKAGRVADEELRYLLEEKPYIPSEVQANRHRINEITDGLSKEGVTIEDINEFVKHRRIATERKGIANPGGFEEKSSTEQLTRLRERLGEDKWEKLNDAMKEHWKVRQEDVISLVEESGLASPELLAKMKDNENYATFNVIDGFEKAYGSANTGYIFKQIGTLADVEGPFVATVMKDASLIRAARMNIIKRDIVKFLKESDDVPLLEAETRRIGKFTEPIEPKDPEMGMITYVDNGKVKAYYTHKDIASTFKYDPAKAHIIVKAWQMMHIPVRSVLVTHNPVWMVRNVVRDFKGTVKNVPGISGPKLAWQYWKSAREVAANAFLGKDTPVIREMLKKKMLPSDRMFASHELTMDAQLEKIMSDVGGNSLKYRNRVVKPLTFLWRQLGNVGKFTERLPKVAGYKILKENQAKTGMSEGRIGHIVRSRVGTPDFYRRGSANNLTNNLFLFSNVAKEGWRSSFEAAKENPARYTWKTLEYNVLPKVALFAAAAGYFGEELKKVVDGVGDYYKENYIVVPLGLTKEGKSVFLTLPQDYTGQVVGGVAWNILNKRTIGAGGVIDYGTSQSPYGLTPLITVPTDIAQYAIHGLNPYDEYAGRLIMSDQIYKAGGVRAAKEMAKYASNQLGGSSIYRFKYDTVDKIQGELEKIVGAPGMGPLNAFIKVSNQGEREALREVTKETEKQVARRQLDVKDKIIASIDSAKGEKPTGAEIVRLFKELRDEGLVSQDRTLSQFKSTYDSYASHTEDNPKVDAVIGAATNEAKIALFKHFEKTMDPEDFRRLRNRMLIEGHITPEAYLEGMILKK